MKRMDALHIGVTMLAILALMLACISLARAESVTMYVCTEVDPLNVRDWPSTTAPRVYRLDRGEAVTVLEIRGGWAYVERCGDYGWCWAEYLGEKSPVDKLPDGWLDVEED